MLAMTWYDWFLAGHVLCAVIWVGGGVTMGVLAWMTVAMKDPARMGEFGRMAAIVGERLYTPMSLLVLLFGIGLMLNGESPWEWDMTWVQIAVAGWILTFVVGFFWIRPATARLGRIAAERGPTDPEAQSLSGRIVLVTRLDSLLLLFIVFVMAAKPWS